MGGMPDAMENAIVDYLTRGVQPPALTGPIRVQLLSALGAGDAASTPVAGAFVNYGADAAAAGTTDNAAVLRWEGLANPTTVAGYRILDSAGTPTVTVDNIARTGGSVSVTDGIFEVAAGELDVSAD